MTTWTAGQLALFLKYTTDDRLCALWELLATTGLRRSEALGLRWCDLDLDEGRLSVRQTLAYVGTRPVLDEPKTDQSRRLIMLEPQTVAALNGTVRTSSRNGSPSVSATATRTSCSAGWTASP
jgi:integrase